MSLQAVRTRVWRNGTLEAENFSIDLVSDYLEEPDCLVWADVCGPDKPDLMKLAEELSLDEHAIEDSVAPFERPKASRYATHLFMTAYAVQHDKDSGELVTRRVSAFSLPRGFVTVRADTNFDIDEVVRRWDDNADLMKYGPRALIHGLLDVVIDSYFDAIESLDDSVEEVENNLFTTNERSSRELQRQTFELRKSLVQARRVILPMREVVNTVMRRATEDGNNAELAPYFEDLYDHVLRAAEWTDSLRDMISSIFETNLSLSDTRMNLVMKQLTAWAAIIAVPTAITGYFGQNVPYPGFGKHWGYLESLGLIAGIALVLYTLFKRKDWL
ncbi:MAG TPA: magnesium transporter CorA family protein [Jatrophihabitantaceae bacterium]|nr:magnesium transporter CorA family protein [Jatrophihabitantaceae bacterium]